MSKKAFILIDYSNDLIADDGVLSCGKPAQAIAPVACAYMEEFLQQGDMVVVCNDYHDAPDQQGHFDPYHPETALFPPHNVAGTHGAELYLPVQKTWQKLHQQYPFTSTFFHKMRFSAFAGTKLDLWLRSHGVTEVVLAGVCTDICVLHTAIDAYNHGYQITIALDATCSNQTAGYEFAIDHCQNLLGAKLCSRKADSAK